MDTTPATSAGLLIKRHLPSDNDTILHKSNVSNSDDSSEISSQATPSFSRQNSEEDEQQQQQRDEDDGDALIQSRANGNLSDTPVPTWIEINIEAPLAETNADPSVKKSSLSYLPRRESTSRNERASNYTWDEIKHDPKTTSALPRNSFEFNGSGSALNSIDSSTAVKDERKRFFKEESVKKAALIGKDILQFSSFATGDDDEL